MSMIECAVPLMLLLLLRPGVCVYEFEDGRQADTYLPTLPICLPAQVLWEVEQML